MAVSLSQKVEHYKEVQMNEKMQLVAVAPEDLPMFPSVGDEATFVKVTASVGVKVSEILKGDMFRWAASWQHDESGTERPTHLRVVDEIAVGSDSVTIKFLEGEDLTIDRWLDPEGPAGREGGWIVERPLGGMWRIVSR